MTTRTTTWVLNLDAEIELDRLQVWTDSGKAAQSLGYVTPKPLAALIETYAQKFAAVLPANASVLTHTIAPELPGTLGLCWCPTPSAIARLNSAKATLVASPSAEVIQRVNHRHFCADLGQPLPEARFIETLPEILEQLARPSPTGAWLCKRPLGFAGRGQRRIRSEPEPADHRWLQESLPHGGLQIEPFVSIVAEYSIHGLVYRDQRFRLGRLCQQRVDEHRAWSSAEVSIVTPLDQHHLEQLQDEASRVATALANQGYFGPFSVDAYSWKTPSGNLQLNARSEINARMTMAYPIGMGDTWLDELLDALT